MLPPIRRVYVEIQPCTRLLEHGGELHKVRIAIDTGGHSFVQELLLKPDDFESRFDHLFDMAKRTLHSAIAREAKHSQTESLNGEAQKDDAPGVHA